MLGMGTIGNLPAFQQFEEAVKEQMQKTGCNRQRAIKVVALRRPDLHEAFVAATGGAHQMR